MMAFSNLSFSALAPDTLLVATLLSLLVGLLMYFEVYGEVESASRPRSEQFFPSVCMDCYAEEFARENGTCGTCGSAAIYSTLNGQWLMPIAERTERFMVM